MTDHVNDDTTLYAVVVNHEGQYSIWTNGWAIPDGWHATGFTGTRADCLAHIDEVWTDMRPVSVRSATKEAR
jgi:MbtH protein